MKVRRRVSILMNVNEARTIAIWMQFVKIPKESGDKNIEAFFKDDQQQITTNNIH